MKKSVCFIILMVFFNISLVIAEKLSIEKPLHYKGPFSGKIQLDNNDNKCARVIVSMPYGEKEVDIECSRKIGNVEKRIGTYSFWVAPPNEQGKQSFTIRTNEFSPLPIDLWTTDGKLLGGYVYEVDINVPPSDKNTNDCRNFRLSEQNLTMSPLGEKKYITVYGGSDWHLDKTNSEMMKVSRNGNIITVECERNEDSFKSDWFEVACGNKSYRVSVSQGKTSKKNDCEFSINPKFLSFPCEGGTEHIKVQGSSNWYLRDIYSSMYKVSKIGDRIKIKCKRNKNNYRSSSFYVKCGDKTETVYVAQDGCIKGGYRTFILPVFGYSTAYQPSAGILIGGVKKIGWYVKGRTGFFFPYGLDIHTTDYFNEEDGYFLSYDSEKSDLSITGGLSIRFGRSPLCLTLGGGCENRMVLQKSMSGKWVKVENDSYKGVVAESSLLFFIRHFSISAGFSTILKDIHEKNHYGTFELGIGANF